MPTWAAPAWAVAMSIGLGAGSAVIMWIALKIAERARIPKDLAGSRDDLEIGVRNVINQAMQLSEAVRNLVIICKRMPPEYKPIAEHALRLAQLMEEATFEEGARHGLFARPLFTAGTQPPDPVPVPEPDEELPPAETNVLPFRTRTREWIRGQLLRTA